MVIVRPGRPFELSDFGNTAVQFKAHRFEFFDLGLDHPHGGFLKVGQGPRCALIQRDGKVLRDLGRRLLGQHPPGLLKPSVKFGGYGFKIGQIRR